MAKKKKQKPQTPTLSKSDKTIYCILIAISCTTALFLAPVVMANFKESVFEDPHILAQNGSAMIIFIFATLFAGAGFALLFDWLRRKRQPIFGKSDVNYITYAKPLYPLFSKQFWKNMFRSKKKASLFGCCILFFILFIFIIPPITKLTLTPRNRLYDDGSIEVRNCLNEITEQYSPSDVEEIKFYTQLYRSRRRRFDSYEWRIGIKISMCNGESFSFLRGDFQTMEDIYLAKNCFDPNIITVEGTENIEEVIQDMNLDNQDTEWLYKIFEITPSS